MAVRSVPPATSARMRGDGTAKPAACGAGVEATEVVGVGITVAATPTVAAFAGFGRAAGRGLTARRFGTAATRRTGRATGRETRATVEDRRVDDRRGEDDDEGR